MACKYTKVEVCRCDKSRMCAHMETCSDVHLRFRSLFSRYIWTQINLIQSILLFQDSAFTTACLKEWHQNAYDIIMQIQSLHATCRGQEWLQEWSEQQRRFYSIIQGGPSSSYVSHGSLLIKNVIDTYIGFKAPNVTDTDKKLLSRECKEHEELALALIESLRSNASGIDYCASIDALDCHTLHMSDLFSRLLVLEKGK